MKIPLHYKLVALVAGTVVLVTGALVMSWVMAHGQTSIDNLNDAAASDFLYLALANAAMWILIAALLSGIYVRRITLPLSQVLEAAEAVEFGDYDVQVPVPFGDEMETFCRRFNHLVTSLKQQRSQINALVTDLNEANSSLADDVQRSERLAALGTLSAGLAHELNNLLHSILGYATIVQTDLGKEHPLGQDLSIIRRECMQAHELLERFLLFARPSNLQTEAADVTSLLDSCMDLLAVTLQQKNIDVLRHVERDLPPLNCDFVMLEHAIFNLLLNAVQAMPDGGELTLDVGSLEGEGMLALCIGDTGTGIDPEHLPHIFDPFFTTKGPGEGTGLGLAIAHRIVEQHGGRIKVQSKLGEGTRFCLHLPADNLKSPGGNE